MDELPEGISKPREEKTPKRPRTKRPRNQEQQGEQSVNPIKRKPRRRWDELRENHGNTHITVCRTDGQRGFAARFGELNPALWDSLEGWEGVGG